MTDKELTQIIAPYILSALASRSWVFSLNQKPDPTQQGVPNGPAIFIQFLYDIDYGHPETQSNYVSATNTFDSDENQIIISKFQISCLIPQNVRNTNLPTARDVAQYLKQYVASRTVARALVKQGVNIFRVSEVRGEWFEDDKDQQENHPSFDLDLCHVGKVTFSVPAVDNLVPKEIDPFGSGIFPVP